jgi:hypothetical protein
MAMRWTVVPGLGYPALCRARQHALHALEQQAIPLGCWSVSVIVNAPPTPTTTSSVAWTPDLSQNGKEEQGIDVCCLTVEAEVPL